MRHIYPFIVGASLSLCPAIGLASTGAASAAVTETRALPSTASGVVAQPPVHVSSAPKVSKTDRERYAARDATSTEAKSYRGGDTVVIGTTAVVAILAVVLLVVLL